MIVRIRVEKVYGVVKFYPANPEAELFAAIAGTRTLTRNAIETLQKLPDVVVEYVVLSPLPAGVLVSVEA